MALTHHIARVLGCLAAPALSVVVAADPLPQDLHGSVADPRVRAALDGIETAGDPLESFEGVVLQAATIRSEEGGEGVQEWFLEGADGATIAVALTAVSTPTPPRPGMRVRIQGRSIGELQSVARDGAVRRWPLWIGRPISAVAATSDRMAAIIFGATGVALAGWVVLRVALRRRLVAGREKVEVHATVRPKDSSVAGGGDVESLAAAVHAVEEPRRD